MYKKLRDFELHKQSPFKDGKDYVKYAVSFDFSTCTKAAVQMLSFVAKHMDNGLVRIVPATASAELGVPLEKAYRGIGDLLEVGILAKKEYNDYWVNQAVIKK